MNRFSCMMNFLNLGVRGRQRGQMDALEAQKTALTHTVAARPALEGPRRRSASASAPYSAFSMVFFVYIILIIVVSIFN